MKRLVSVMLLLFTIACSDEHTELAAVTPGPQPAPVAVAPLSPPSNAREIRPGTFILDLSRRKDPGGRIEDLPEIMLFETIYDQTEMK